MRHLRLILAGFLAVLGLALPAAVAAQSDAEGPYLAVRGVDSTSSDVVRLTLAYDGDAADLEGAVITDNGVERPVEGEVVPYAATGQTRAVVVAVDTSEAMDPVMADLRDAAQAVVDGISVDTPVAIATFADRFIPVRGLTTDRDALTETIDGLQANGESVLYDGIAGSAELLVDDAPDAQPNVVVITGSGNYASAAGPGRAVGALRDAGSPLYAVGLEGGRLDAGGLNDVVQRAGGRFVTTADPEALDELGAEMAAGIDQQYVVAYEALSAQEGGPVGDLTVQVGDVTTTASFVRGADVTDPGLLVPQDVETGSGGLFQSDLAKYLGVALVLAAAAVGAFALMMLTQPDDSHLTSVLSPYAEGVADSPFDDDDTGLARTALIQRAVDMTEEIAERQGILAQAEDKLERADLPLRAAEALFFYVALVVVAGLLGLVLTKSLLGVLLLAGLMGLLPLAFLNLKASRRLKAFNGQLPDTLQLLAGTLRAGYSLMQGVEAVSREVDDPIGYELRRVVTESRLGRPLEEALESAAARMGSADFKWAVMAISIQREVGGNLAELLMTVSETMTARERLRRDVAALTAEGKVSAMVLGFLPIGLAATMFVVNPEYIGLLFSEKIGNIMLIGAVMLASFGFWWMKKMIEIDV